VITNANLQLEGDIYREDEHLHPFQMEAPYPSRDFTLFLQVRELLSDSCETKPR